MLVKKGERRSRRTGQRRAAVPDERLAAKITTRFTAYFLVNSIGRGATPRR